MSKKIIKFCTKLTHILFILYVFNYFFYCMNKSGHINSLIYNKSLMSFNNDTATVNAQLYDNDPYNTIMQNFINNSFSTRNKGFLSGDVKNLYDYYNINSGNGKYSLDYEFKRISYLRDWAIERGIIFTAVNSRITVNSISKNDTSLIVKADEECTFSYIYNDGKAPNEFSLSIPHILTINNAYSNFIIEKDYYVDFLNDDLHNYNFTLSEETLPYTKRLNNNYSIDNKLSIDCTLRYEKFPFTDHKAVISNFDSNGYPLITTSILNIKNMPYDLGWSLKNIKLSSN